jgi:tetratricopeptide (TPR) repeat protein
LEQWVSALAEPVDIRARAPQLLLYYAKALSAQQQFSESDTLLALAQPALEERADPLLLANLYETQGFNAYMRREYPLAIRLARRAVESLELIADQGIEERLRFAQARRVEALATYYLGERVEGLTQLEDVVLKMRALVEVSPEEAKESAYNLAVTLQDLGVFYFQQGRLGDALRSFMEVEKLWRQHQLNPAELPAILNNLAFLYHRSGQQEAALQTYLEAAEMARKQGAPNLAIILAGIGEIYYEEERREEAQKVLQEAKSVAERSEATGFLASVYQGLARLEAASGQFAAAFEHLRQASVLLGYSQESGWYRVWEARLYWLLNDKEEALSKALQWM